MKRKAAPKPTPAPEPQPSAPPKSQTLLDLQKFCETKFKVRLNFGTAEKPNIFETEGKLLTPAQQATLNELRSSVLPAVVKGPRPEDDRLDYVDAGYVKRKSEVDLQVRSLALYWAYGEISAEKPGLTDRKLIHEFVQSKFTEQVLVYLEQALRQADVSEAALVNFI